MKYQGIGASAGVAVSKIYLLDKTGVKHEEKSRISPDDEKRRFARATEEFIAQTIKLIENADGDERALILDGQLLMAEDPKLVQSVIASIEKDGTTAEFAVYKSFSKYADVFASMEDELMRLRGLDLLDIMERLIDILSGNKAASVEDIDRECILVTRDLTPSDTARMNKSLIKGIVTEIGGTLSHTAIIARALGIPAVLGIEGITIFAQGRNLAIIDGAGGFVTFDPTPDEVAEAENLIFESGRASLSLEVFKNAPAVSMDGRRVFVCANIGGIADIEPAVQNGADGVGLFRTEFIYMDKTEEPSEDEQFEIYKQVAQAFAPRHVVVRTLDIGGDKYVPYLNLEAEDNPFLGCRAVRLCLERKEMFKTQLRAILRASAFGKLKIMIPMISCVEELRECKEIIGEIRRSLSDEGVAFDGKIQVGIMIETPAAALISDLLARECDFFSIGTNDLTQYTLAADRGNYRVAYLCSTFNPAVLRSIVSVIENAKKAGIPVGMCGEAAGDQMMIPFLLGAGLDEFSMSASGILRTKQLIGELEYDLLRERLPEILELATAEEVKQVIGKRE